MKICFIGFGNLAKAIAHSLEIHASNYQIYATAPSLKPGKTAEGIFTHPDNFRYLAEAEIVILAVKPNKAQEVLTNIADKLPKNCLLISVAAGLNLAWLETHCYPGQAIIRAMPNIACIVGKGATPLVANTRVSQEQKISAEKLFQCSGIVTWVKEENDIDLFTALSGSGPAYVFLFMEAMINAAKKSGLDEEVAKTFALQTVAGATELVLNSSLNIKELRQKVTSPAGTTAAAIAVFQQYGLEELVFKAMDSAVKRAKELGSN